MMKDANLISWIVQVLQIGFSGFGFLLAAMAYKLIGNQNLPQKNAELVRPYMRFSLALGILALLVPAGIALVNAYVEFRKVQDDAISAASQEKRAQAVAITSLWLTGYVFDGKGHPMRHAKVGLKRLVGDSKLVSASTNEGLPDLNETDQNGGFHALFKVGGPTDVYRISVEAPHHNSQEINIGPGGAALTVNTFLPDSEEN